MYAVVRTGGKQYRVAEGDVIQVERLDAEVLDQTRGPKIIIFKKKRRKGYRRKKGHRQDLTVLRVREIAAGA